MFIRQALSDYWRGNSASLKNKVIILLLKNFVTDTGFLSHRCRRYPHLNLKTWTLETTLTNLQNGAKTVKKTQRIPNKNNSLDKTISDFRFHSNRGPKWILCFTITELWNCADTVVGSQKWYTYMYLNRVAGSIIDSCHYEGEAATICRNFRLIRAFGVTRGGAESNHLAGYQLSLSEPASHSFRYISILSKTTKA